MRLPVFFTLFAIAVVGLTGCSSSSVGPTTGQVHFEDGSPVQSGSIEFRSLADGKRYASRIQPDGSFHPVDSDNKEGLPAGEYEVVVVQVVLTEDLAAEMHSHGTTVPRRYADYFTSELRTEVKEGQEDPIDVALESE